MAGDEPGGLPMRSLIFVAILLLPYAAQAAETIKYKYDARGRVIKVERTGSVNNNVKADYEYDKANNRKRVKVVKP